MTAKTETGNRELSVSRIVDAPVSLVYEVWTNPDHIRHWWGPNGFTNTIDKMDVRKGGEWQFTMHGPDGTDYRNECVYDEVEKERRLVYTHLSGPKFQATVTFEALGDKTRVSIRSEFESAEQLEQVIKVFKADEGMRQNIDRFEAYLAKL